MVVDTKKLLKVVVKHDGNKTKAAKELRLTQQAVSKRVNRNPEIKQKILNVRDEAMRRAGISRSIVYRRIREGLDAKVVATVEGIPTQTNIKDHKERREHAKLCLQLFKDLEPDKEFAINNIATVIFNVLTQTKREKIKVI